MATKKKVPTANMTDAELAHAYRLEQARKLLDSVESELLAMGIEVKDDGGRRGRARR